jgi:hypothetical protein
MYSEPTILFSPAVWGSADFQKLAGDSLTASFSATVASASGTDNTGLNLVGRLSRENAFPLFVLLAVFVIGWLLYNTAAVALVALVRNTCFCISGGRCCREKVGLRTGLHFNPPFTGFYALPLDPKKTHTLTAMEEKQGWQIGIDGRGFTVKQRRWPRDGVTFGIVHKAKTKMLTWQVIAGQGIASYDIQANPAYAAAALGIETARQKWEAARAKATPSLKSVKSTARMGAQAATSMLRTLNSAANIRTGSAGVGGLPRTGTVGPGGLAPIPEGAADFTAGGGAGMPGAPPGGGIAIGFENGEFDAAAAAAAAYGQGVGDPYAMASYAGVYGGYGGAMDPYGGGGGGYGYGAAPGMEGYGGGGIGGGDPYGYGYGYGGGAPMMGGYGYGAVDPAMAGYGYGGSPGGGGGGMEYGGGGYFDPSVTGMGGGGMGMGGYMDPAMAAAMGIDPALMGGMYGQGYGGAPGGGDPYGWSAAAGVGYGYDPAAVAAAAPGGGDVAGGAAATGAAGGPGMSGGRGLFRAATGIPQLNSAALRVEEEAMGLEDDDLEPLDNDPNSAGAVAVTVGGPAGAGVGLSARSPAGSGLAVSNPVSEPGASTARPLPSLPEGPPPEYKDDADSVDDAAVAAAVAAGAISVDRGSRHAGGGDGGRPSTAGSTGSGHRHHSPNAVYPSDGGDGAAAGLGDLTIIADADTKADGQPRLSPPSINPRTAGLGGAASPDAPPAFLSPAGTVLPGAFRLPVDGGGGGGADSRLGGRSPTPSLSIGSAPVSARNNGGSLNMPPLVPGAILSPATEAGMVAALTAAATGQAGGGAGSGGGTARSAYGGGSA